MASLLYKLQKHQQTHRWIISELQHETREGIHTFHQCECGRMATRGGNCVLCWAETLIEYQESVNAKHAPFCKV